MLETLSLFLLEKTMTKNYIHEDGNVYVNVSFVLIWRVIALYTYMYK